MSPERHANRLIDETSPYLLQHAHNPVDWYPWNQEALDRARHDNKPILLSIGYSACHWCHVMAHECFEDPEVAAVMNELFVNVKVDREERPDLDKIYQTAYQLLIGRGGGWPLNMFLTPDDQAPFFGGTYFPKQPRHGLPAFTEVLRRVADFYHTQRDEIDKQNASLLAVLQPRPAGAGEAVLGPAPLQSARDQLGNSFDARHGGFGAAPKFPHPTSIERLLRQWAASTAEGTPDEEALRMARLTLHAMASGGIYDQLGGGFCRYSVDDHWSIPHFEKMLYDNGPLLALYADAWAATGDGAFARVAGEVGDWVLREMQSPEGGFYSTLDADSEGEEGRFYAWTHEQVREVLDEEEYPVIARHYGLDGAPNFEGKWHLRVVRPLEEVAAALALPAEHVHTLLARGRDKLFQARERRVRPGRDEKILTSWNGLMIKGLAVAARRLERPDFQAAAEAALDFLRGRLFRDGRLLATYNRGEARLAAYLDDYVYLIDGVLELLQNRWRDGDLAFALTLAEQVLTHFEDREHGGFFFTADDHEQLIQRPKPLPDDATPSGNGIAAYVLNRLGHLIGEVRYLEAAERTLKTAWPDLLQTPYAYNALLLALEEHLQPPQTVVIRAASSEAGPWLRRATACYAPARLALHVPPDAAALPGALAERRIQETATAYVCNALACSPPVTELTALDALLAGREIRR